MITGTELTDAYLSHMGYRRLDGGGMTPILPFFILDAMFQIYSKVVAPMNVSHKEKQMRRRWIEAYNLFNRDFFSAFSQDQQDAIIDRMDDFGTFIHNNIEIARIQVMNIMGNDDTDTQMTISSIMMCNVLAQAANSVWTNTYVKKDGKPLRNRYIDTIERMSYKFMNAMHGNRYRIDPNQNQSLCDAVQVLCRKMVKWLNEDFAKNN